MTATKNKEKEVVAKLLSKARIAFKEGRYHEALSICKELRSIKCAALPFAQISAIEQISSIKIKQKAHTWAPSEANKRPEFEFLCHKSQTSTCNPLKSSQRKTSIIIPVYNALSEFKTCIQSLESTTRDIHRVLIINDCSTDPAIHHYCTSKKWKPNFVVYHNSVNLGFTKTINKGIDLAGEDDVIILNSDAEVSGGWHQSLKMTAYSANAIGTVTPLSDNAGPFSIQASLNEESWERSQLILGSPAASAELQSMTPQVPTGHGFCMFIKRDLINTIGKFDEAAFPRGYGEENDFCLRALKSGYTNAVDIRCIVRHLGAASFGESKKASLVGQGRKMVDAIHPDYKKKITEAFNDKEYISIITRVSRFLERTDIDNSIPILFLAGSKTGGTPQTNKDLMKYLATHSRFAPFCLYCRDGCLELSHTCDNGIEHFSDKYYLKNPVSLPTHTSEEYDKIFYSLLHYYRFRLVHIRHIGWHSANVPLIAKSLAIPVLASVHDFYTICPTVKLLDDKYEFCAGNCTSSSNDCTPDLWNSFPGRLKNDGVWEWRKLMSDFFENCDEIVTTSESARSLVRSHYSSHIKDKIFHVIEHGRDFASINKKPIVSPVSGEKIKILVPGNINEAKGAAILNKIANDAALGRVEYHVLGRVRKGLFDKNDRIVVHGEYSREEFHRHVERINPLFGLILSIWPETYCHTLSEMWSLSIPVLAIDLGAVGERIRKFGGGWLCSTDINKIRNKILGLSENIDEVAKERAYLSTIVSRNTNLIIRSIEEMGKDYIEIYARLLQLMNMA